MSQHGWGGPRPFALRAGIGALGGAGCGRAVCARRWLTRLGRGQCRRQPGGPGGAILASTCTRRTRRRSLRTRPARMAAAGRGGWWSSPSSPTATRSAHRCSAGIRALPSVRGHEVVGVVEGAASTHSFASKLHSILCVSDGGGGRVRERSLTGGRRGGGAGGGQEQVRADPHRRGAEAAGAAAVRGGALLRQVRHVEPVPGVRVLRPRGAGVHDVLGLDVQPLRLGARGGPGPTARRATRARRCWPNATHTPTQPCHHSPVPL